MDLHHEDLERFELARFLDFPMPQGSVTELVLLSFVIWLFSDGLLSPHAVNSESGLPADMLENDPQESSHVHLQHPVLLVGIGF